MIKYKFKNGEVLKDGHTMFPQDIVKDLNRKAYLEHKGEGMINKTMQKVVDSIKAGAGIETDPRFICPKCGSNDVVLYPYFGSISECKKCGYRWNS